LLTLLLNFLHLFYIGLSLETGRLGALSPNSELTNIGHQIEQQTHTEKCNKSIKSCLIYCFVYLGTFIELEISLYQEPGSSCR
jgi:hypothetical protein